MYVCIYICMYVCMRVCVYVCMRECGMRVCMRDMCVCMRVCVYDKCGYCMCMYVCMYACMRVSRGCMMVETHDWSIDGPKLAPRLLQDYQKMHMRLCNFTRRPPLMVPRWFQTCSNIVRDSKFGL